MDKRAVMTTLIDILSIFSRNNLKSELLIEIERLSRVLGIVASSPEVDTKKLQDMEKDMMIFVCGRFRC